MIYSLVRFISMLILKIFFRLRVSGIENVPKEGGFILACNHTSYLDPVALSVACSRKVSFMAKDELFSNAFFSRFFYSLKCFPVKRDSVDLSAVKEAMRRLKKGEGLVLFPEGGRRIGRDSTAFYPGIGYLAQKMNVPVVPVCIRGADSALPKGAKLPRFGRIRVSLAKPVHADKKLPYDDVVQQVMQEIIQMQEVA